MSLFGKAEGTPRIVMPLPFVKGHKGVGTLNVRGCRAAGPRGALRSQQGGTYRSECQALVPG
jgi:hypothetical protein